MTVIIATHLYRIQSALDRNPRLRQQMAACVRENTAESGKQFFKLLKQVPEYTDAALVLSPPARHALLQALADSLREGT